ncbi:MAG: hypothetical protein R2684_14485 [Pyrinomonadaceae bacterium]
MIRNVGSVLIGLLIGGVVFTAFRVVGILLIGLPAGYDAWEASSNKELVDAMTPGIWALVFTGYFTGTFACGYVIGRFAESKTRIFPFMASLMFMMGWLSIIVTVPHPLVVSIIGFLIYLPAAFLGHLVGIRSRSKKKSV